MLVAAELVSFDLPAVAVDAQEFVSLAPFEYFAPSRISWPSSRCPIALKSASARFHRKFPKRLNEFRDRKPHLRSVGDCKSAA